MKRTYLATLLIAATFSLGMSSMTAQAAGHRAPLESALQLADNQISAKQAARIAQRQNGGRVLSVKLKNAGSGNAYYAVKLIKNGKVSIVNVPAN